MPSASVTIKELDLTAVAPSFPGLYIGMVLPDAVKGPVNKAVLNTSEKQFLSRYTKDGTVTAGANTAYFSALAVLNKSDKLWVVRPTVTGMTTAGCIINVPGTVNTSLSTGFLSPDSVSMSAESFRIWGSSPGSFANSLRVAIWNYKAPETFTAETTGSTLTILQNYGVAYPVKVSSSGTLPAPLVAGTTYFTTASASGSMKLATTQANAIANTTIILTTVGTGTHTIKPAFQYAKSPNTFYIQVFDSIDLVNPKETFVVSKDRNAKSANGTSAYIEEVTKSSNYIYITDNVSVSGLYVQDQIVPIALGGGVDGSAATDSDCIRALSEFSNVESIPVTVLIDAGRNTVVYQQAMINLCENRRDCVSILSVPFASENNADYLTAIDDYVNNQLNVNSSYAAIYTTSLLIYDKFNDRQIYISPDAYVAALISNATVNYEMWYPVAGFKRGVLNNVVDVKVRFTKAEMDFLVDRSINTVRFAKNKGIAIWSQRTLLKTETSTSRLNVRLALINIEPALQADLEPFLQDLNDDDTRALARISLNNTLKNFKSRKALADYELVMTKRADETNPYAMTVTGYIVPMYSIEQIPVTISLTDNLVSISVGN